MKTQLNITEIATLCGVARETVAKKVAELPFETPEGHIRGGKTYHAPAALRAVLAGGSDAQAEALLLARTRREVAQLQADNLRIEIETKRRERIPLETVMDVQEQCNGMIAGIMRRTLDKTMDLATINEIFAELRDAYIKLVKLGPKDKVDGADWRKDLTTADSSTTEA